MCVCTVRFVASCATSRSFTLCACICVTGLCHRRHPPPRHFPPLSRCFMSSFVVVCCRCGARVVRRSHTVRVASMIVPCVSMCAVSDRSRHVLSPASVCARGGTVGVVRPSRALARPEGWSSRCGVDPTDISAPTPKACKVEFGPPTPLQVGSMPLRCSRQGRLACESHPPVRGPRQQRRRRDPRS